ncbi:N-formylglutamate amidohydrolase [Phaeobacter sp.]|uniref:N-formylglutamate amidohydrolase n=1 Tax=Phaeobacter sp. TaxID=1902409 RepID=UPI0025ECD4DE|nr:N-formylglutamate amidohydrolase [Phaeobacter sp.]
MSPSDSNAPFADLQDRTDAPVEVWNADGAGEVIVLCEHASNHIPQRYGDLGLTAAHRNSHTVWDPGARAVSLALAKALDCPMIASRVSRLVYDCNRPPEAPSAMPSRSEVIEVPGNRALDQAARDERVQSVYRPFCEAVTQLIMARQHAGRQPVLVTVHSFTPVYHGTTRAVEIGILHDDDSRLADAMLDEAAALPHRQIERNSPYGPEDGVTHSLQLHGQRNGIANVMLEIRNDLLADPEAEQTMAEEVLTLLRPALDRLEAATPATTAPARQGGSSDA